MDFVFSGRDAKKSSFGEVFMDVTAQKCHTAPDWGDIIYFKQVEKRDNKILNGKMFNLLIMREKRKIEIIFRREKYSYTQLLNLKVLF